MPSRHPHFQKYWRGRDLGPRVYAYDSNTPSSTLGLTGDVELFAREFS